VLPLVAGKTLGDFLHPGYAAASTARAFWRHSHKAAHNYAGGVDAAGQSILPPHPNETESRFTQRKTAAIARPYCRSILSRFNDFVTRHDVVRAKAAGPYAAFIDDATGNGVSLDRLLKRALRRAQIEAASYLLCDALRPEQFPTAAAAQAAGQRGVVRLISADAILDWREVDGEIVEAAILLEDVTGFFIWNVDRSHVQRVEVEGDRHAAWSGWKIANVFEAQTHTYGACPLVRLRPEFDEEDGGNGDSQAAPIAESQRRICNFESWHWEELRNITFTTTVLLGVDPQTVKDVAIGPGKALCVPQAPGGSLPQVGKIAADTAQAQSLRDAVRDEIREVYRAAGLAAGNPEEVGAPESGVAKAFRFDEVAAKLKALADACEAAENGIVERLAKDGGWAYPGDANWPDEFDAPDLAAELDDVIRLESSHAPAVLVEQAWRDYAALAFSLDAAQTARLEAELTEASERKAEARENPFGGLFGDMRPVEKPGAGKPPTPPPQP